MDSASETCEGRNYLNGVIQTYYQKHMDSAINNGHEKAQEMEAEARSIKGLEMPFTQKRPALGQIVRFKLKLMKTRSTH